MGDNNEKSGRYRHAGQTGPDGQQKPSVKLRSAGSPPSNAALAGGQAAALSELFVADSHWRNLFGISWYFATFSGNATVVGGIAGAGGARSAPPVSGSTRQRWRRARPWSPAAT